MEAFLLQAVDIYVDIEKNRGSYYGFAGIETVSEPKGTTGLMYKG